LHLEELSRIESEVSWETVVAEKSGLGNGDILRLDPTYGGTLLLLGGTNSNGEWWQGQRRILVTVGLRAV
jgi:hypothetical protein